MHERARLPIAAVFTLALQMVAALASPVCDLKEPSAEITALQDAMDSRDGDRIQDAITPLREKFADASPEQRESYSSVRLADADHVFSAHARLELARLYLDEVRAQSWWLDDPDPNPRDNPAPQRWVAELLRGSLAIADAYPPLHDEAMHLATAAGDYIVRASAQSGFAGAPFPYWRGRGGRLGHLSEAAARALERCGILQDSVTNGWLVVDSQPQEYFFDTGLSGEAIALLQARHPDPAYAGWLDAAGAWARAQPYSTNFNYNAFLAQFHAATGDFTNAHDRLLYGVLSGMTDDGHWIDPHNDRLVYRAIMVRAMVATTLAAFRAGDDTAVRDWAAKTGLALGAIEHQMAAAQGVAVPLHLLDIYMAIDDAGMAGAPPITTDRSVRKAARAYVNAHLIRQRVDGAAAIGRYIARLELDAR